MVQRSALGVEQMFRKRVCSKESDIFLVGCFTPGLRVGYVTLFHLNTQDDEQQYAYDYQPTNPPAHHHIVCIRCLPLVFRWSGYEELACAHY